MRYSPSTGCFYPETITYSALPDDLITVSDDDYQAAIDARAGGATLAVQDGALVIVPAPAPSAAALLAKAQSVQAAAVRAACSAQISGGFQSSALGAVHTYPSSQTDQANMTGAVTASIMAGSAAGWTINFWCADASGNWAFVPHTAAQIQGVYADGITALQTLQARNLALQTQITEATTVDAVQAIVWS